MEPIASRTLSNYRLRYAILVNRWKSFLPNPDDPRNLVTSIDNLGDIEFKIRDPSYLELALLLKQELDEKNSDYADAVLLGDMGKELKMKNHRKLVSFESDRSALLYFASRMISENHYMSPQQTSQVRQAITMLGEIGDQLKKLRKNKKIRRAEKSDKPKKLPEPDWIRLAEELMSAYLCLMRGLRKTNAMRAAIFISAGLATGARPGEWAHASWANAERTAVRFFTSKRKVAGSKIFKNKPQKAVAQEEPFRDIPFDPTYREHIERHFYYLSEIFKGCDTDEQRDEAMDKYTKRCGAAMLSARKKIPEWAGDASRAYTLYVTRSQYAALQSLLDPIRKHEKMGWSSASTSASSYYGRAKDALGARGDVMHQKNALDPGALLDPFADLESNADKVKTSAVSESSTEQPAAAADLEGDEASGESGEGDTDDDFEEPTRPRG